MKVDFKVGWFGPGAQRYRKGVQEVADEHLPLLPKTAKVVTGKKAAPAEPKGNDIARVEDIDRAAADAAAERIRKAEEFRLRKEAEDAKKKG